LQAGKSNADGEGSRGLTFLLLTHTIPNPFHTALVSSSASFINAQFVEQTDGTYLVKTKGGAHFEFVAADFKSAIEQLVMEIGLLKKTHVLPEDFNTTTQVKIDLAG
jgi:hypothetical protein